MKKIGKNHISRRLFLGAAAAMTAPAIISRSHAADVDVIIIGAGAAGTAAAHTLKAAGKSCLILEAAAYAGGRCITDQTVFGIPYDPGAHWIHGADLDLVKTGISSSALEIMPSPHHFRLKREGRDARERDREDYLVAVTALHRDIMKLGQGRKDAPAAQAAPAEAGSWSEKAAYALGEMPTGHALEKLSAREVASAVEKDEVASVRQGYGAALAQMARSLPVRLKMPVKAINLRGPLVGVTTPSGTLAARMVIVTVSPKILSEERIKIMPSLPDRLISALHALSDMGHLLHIAMHIPHDPWSLASDETVISASEKGQLRARLSGSDLYYLDIGGEMAAELAGQGHPAIEAYARNWLEKNFSIGAGEAVTRIHALDWAENPFTRGSFAAVPMGAAAHRQLLQQPFQGRLYFAGESISLTRWGTVGGAWESGERAARDILKRLKA